MEEPSLFSKSGSDHALQNRSKACKQFFRDCLERPDLDDDWLEEKCAEFNWWSSGLNADKRGPGSLDARLRLRPDVQDVIVDVLDGLKTALGKYYSIGISDPSTSDEGAPDTVETEGEPSSLEEDIRAPSPWSDMTDDSENVSTSTPNDETDAVLHEPRLGGNQNTEKSAPPDADVYREQRVYIETNLEILLRIYTAIKRAGNRFRYQRADDALKQDDENFQRRTAKAEVGYHKALGEEAGSHERFRRYLTRLVLRNGYTENLIQRLNFRLDQRCEDLMRTKGKIDKVAEDQMSDPTRKIDKLSIIMSPGNKDYYKLLLQNVVLIVLRAYFVDPARLTTVQSRLINANVVRRNRLLYAGAAARSSHQTAEEHRQPLQKQPRAPIHILVNQVYQTPAGPLPSHQSPTMSLAEPKQGKSETDHSYVKQPATALESRFSITRALTPGGTTRSAATKMSARLGALDYPKCPSGMKSFPCPYCRNILESEYTKKEKWRGHVAQDLCAYVCVFEECKSPDDMFASTYAWMSHMAKFHSEVEWVCPKCAQDGKFETAPELKSHIVDSHPPMDTSDLELVVEASRRVLGIQKTVCPLCRPGLVTLEMNDDEETCDDLPLYASKGQPLGLIQLEKDEHIATHIHEFALHSFPLESLGVSSLNSLPSTREDIPWDSFQNTKGKSTDQEPWLSLNDVGEMIEDIVGKLSRLRLSIETSADFAKKLAYIQHQFSLMQDACKASNLFKHGMDLGAFASTLNEGLQMVSQLEHFELSSRHSLRYLSERSDDVAALSDHTDLLASMLATEMTSKNSKQPRKSVERKFLIAVDFGATYSSVAWTQIGKSEAGKAPDIRIINDWKNGDDQLKVPTMLQKTQTEGWTWGHEVDPSERRYEWFNLEQDLESNSRFNLKYHYSRMAISPTSIAEMEILVTEYLTMLTKHVKESIKNTFGHESITHQHTHQYIITVPAFWSVSTQNMTLKCARKAGMALDFDIQVISAPEAAAIYGLGEAITDIMLKVGHTCIICDAGGVTVDLISYMITELGMQSLIMESAVGSGDACGSTFLDLDFDAWLTKRFHHIPEWNQYLNEVAMENWKDIKKVYDGDTARTWTFPAKGLRDNERLRIRNGTFLMTGSHINQVFEPVIQRILTLVKLQISENPAGVKAVLLTGGFGDNPYLKARIQDAVGGHVIVERMRDTETSVVRGALLQALADNQPSAGISKTCIQSRRARNHFGVAVLDVYHPAKHDPTRPRIGVGARGSERIEVMQWFITRGDDITDSTPYVFKYYFDESVRSVERKQGLLDSFTMPIYMWAHDTASRPQYPPLGATGSYCRKVIELKVDMNNIPEQLRDRTTSDGETYYKIPFAIEMIWHSANIDFKLVHTSKDGQRYECGADSTKANFLQ